jgi:predicted phosphodiesterase
MRLAIISDIHGNLLALEAVLADIKARGADLIVNCGDLCTSPLWPRETFELLETLALPTVRGNHDRWIADLPADKMSPALTYTRAQLTPAQQAALGALPANRMLEDRIFMCHGTPTDDYTYLLEEQIDGRLALSRPDLIAERLEGVDADVVLCGHSHNPQLVHAPGTKSLGPRLVINPGSVGCPNFADNPQVFLNNARAPHARYAIATKRQGRWSADLIALAYDWDAAAHRARANHREDWAQSYLEGRVTRV